MSWRPNRRFLRDSDELQRRGHGLSFMRDGGKYRFWIDSRQATTGEISELANWYRNQPERTPEQIAEAQRRGEELYVRLRAAAVEQGVEFFD